jgi:aryl-alcohol dehydrogenase-like predicted oxidoreductase
MKQVLLGKTDLLISPLVLGGNVFGWTVDKKKSFEILDAFLDQGFNCVDTADVYSRWVPGNTGGESETILGAWMKERGVRSKMIIATKLGMEMGPGKKGLSKNYIKAAVEDSLKRLQTDYIDLYQSHVEDTETPIEETLGAFEELIQAGKVRHIGASNYSGTGLKLAIEVARMEGLPQYRTLQPVYNLYDRSEFDHTLAPIVKAYKLGVIPYFSLASGFLTGKYRSAVDLKKSARGSRVEGYLNERGFEILKALDTVAHDKNATPAQISIAWLNHNEYITAALASATSVEQLLELTKGAQMELDEASIEHLNIVSE